MSVFGIDFGNESLVIAAAGRGGVNIVTNEASARSTPAMVGFGEGARAIGEAAATTAVSNFRGTIRDLKRFIGRVHADPADIAMLPAKSIIDSETCTFPATVFGEEHVFRSEQILAMLLRKMHGYMPASQATSDCVIAVPAYFDQAQRRAVMNGARIAGLNPLAVMTDLTAAALDYALFRGAELPDEASGKTENILLVDVGESDLKVAAVSLKKGQVVMKSHACDREFGARLFDDVLVKHCAAAFKAKTKVDVYEYPKSLLRLKQACEKAKKVLSANAQAVINIECLAEDRDLNMSVTRDEFETMASPYLSRLLEPIKTVLGNAGWSSSDVSAVELIGGGSRIHAVRRILSEFMGQETKARLNASEAISRGAAIQAAILSPHIRVRETKIQDASFYAHSLAWTPKGSANATTSVVFDRNAAFPASKILSFERGHIEGKELALELVGLGRAIIGGIPNADEKKTQVIKVRASLDHSGLFIVDHAEVVTEWSEQVTEGEETKTVHKKTRSDLTITMEFLPALSIMTQKQIDDATLVEGQLVSQDKLIQETHDRRNALEAYIYAMRSNISERLAGYADDATKQKLSTMLDEQEAWLYTEEGETSNKQTYVDRLSKLQAIGGPIEKRHQEELERPSFVSTLQKTIASLRDKAATFDGIGAEEDKSAIEKKCAEVESWLAQGLQKQATLAKTQNPAITCQEISERTNRLMNDAKPLINKVRAKPEDKKKEDGDVKMEDATPEEVTKDANAEEIEIGGADSGANADKMDLD